MNSPNGFNNNGKKNALWIALGIAWDLGYIIALPIAILGFGGAYLDKLYATSPLFLLIGMGLALLITGIGLYKKVSSLTKND